MLAKIVLRESFKSPISYFLPQSLINELWFTLSIALTSISYKPSFVSLFFSTIISIFGIRLG
jgi:hypothetical protein